MGQAWLPLPYWRMRAISNAASLYYRLYRYEERLELRHCGLYYVESIYR